MILQNNLSHAREVTEQRMEQRSGGATLHKGLAHFKARKFFFSFFFLTRKCFRERSERSESRIWPKFLVFWRAAGIPRSTRLRLVSARKRDCEDDFFFFFIVADLASFQIRGAGRAASSHQAALVRLAFQRGGRSTGSDRMLVVGFLPLSSLF